jgi:hypothetical protein
MTAVVLVAKISASGRRRPFAEAAPAATEDAAAIPTIAAASTARRVVEAMVVT